MRWLVTLTGADADLEQLVEWFDGDDWQTLRHDKHGVVLCGSRFEAADNDECVGRIADELISHINRSARRHASGFRDVSRGAMIEQHQNGDHLTMYVGEGVYVLTGGSVCLVKRGSNGTVIETSEERTKRQQASGFPRLVKLQEEHRDLADALRYLEQEPGMPGLYKAGEAIKCGIGGRKNLAILGTSNTEFRRFTHSAQPARHHRGKGPQNAMAEHEADAYIRVLLKRLIEHLGSTT